MGSVKLRCSLLLVLLLSFFLFWRLAAAPVGLNGGIYAGSCDLRNDVGQIHGTIHRPLIHYNWGRIYLSERKKERKERGVRVRE